MQNSPVPSDSPTDTTAETQRTEIQKLCAEAEARLQNTPADALSLAMQAATLAQATEDIAGLATAQELVGQANLSLQRLDDAESAFTESLYLFTQQGDIRGKGRASSGLGRVQHRRGDMSGALVTLRQALTMSEEVSDLVGRYQTLNALGNLYRTLGDYGVALDMYQAALSISRNRQNRLEEAMVLGNLGVLLSGSKNQIEAIRWQEQALEIFRDLKDTRRIGQSLVNLGSYYQAMEQWAEALLYYEQCLALDTGTGDRRHIAGALDNMGHVYGRLGRREQAEVSFQRSTRMHHELNNPLNLLEAQVSWAAFLRDGTPADAERAMAMLREVIPQAEQMQAREVLYQAHKELALVYKQRGEYAEALEHYEWFHDIQESILSTNTEQRLQNLRSQLEVEAAQREATVAQAKNRELAAALEEARRQRRLALEMANQDSLTGLCNRRHLTELMRTQYEEAQQVSIPLSLMLLDVDNFKQINDEFLHHVGDAVLQQVAEILLEHCPTGGVAARFGGDEFVLLLPHTTLDRARVLADDVKEEIKSYGWESVAPRLAVTISVGLSADTTLPHYEKMLQVADKHLYQAKREGKNRISG